MVSSPVAELPSLANVSSVVTVQPGEPLTVQSLSCAVQPVCENVWHVTDSESVPAALTFTIAFGIGPHVPPASSTKPPRYVAPRVAHGFAAFDVVVEAPPLPPHATEHATMNPRPSTFFRMSLPFSVTSSIIERRGRRRQRFASARSGARLGRPFLSGEQLPRPRARACSAGRRRTSIGPVPDGGHYPFGSTLGRRAIFRRPRKGDEDAVMYTPADAVAM